MSSARANTGKWISFYVFLPGAFEDFLLNHLWPMLEEESVKNSVKRFFFIRYDEGGPHLRLRFLPGRSFCKQAILDRLNELVRPFMATGNHSPQQCAVKEHPYCRTELYFAETILSVYAELCNEYTSKLGLRLMRQAAADRGRLLMLVAAALLFFHSAGGRNRQLAIESAHRSASLIENIVRQYNIFIVSTDESRQDAVQQTLLKAWPRVRNYLSRDHDALRQVLLFARMNRESSKAQKVGAHALHLLCNKVGLSLAEEYRLAQLIRNFVLSRDFNSKD